MRINNFTELSNYMQSNNLSNIGGKLIACKNRYNEICSCTKTLKESKLTECNSNYLETINNLNHYKQQLFANTKDTTFEFYHNNQLVSTIIK